MQKIFKILSVKEWQNFKKTDRFLGSSVDIQDGFIHFSYADQLEETARRHFAGRDDLVLLAVDPAGLGGSLRDEISRGGAFFPHLFAPLFIRDVVWDRPIGCDEAGMPVLPALDSDPVQGTP